MAKVQSLEDFLKDKLITDAKESEKSNKEEKINNDQLRVKFAILYLQLQHTVTFTEFSELSVDDLLQIEQLKANAAEIYTSIVLPGICCGLLTPGISPGRRISPGGD